MANRSTTQCVLSRLRPARRLRSLADGHGNYTVPKPRGRHAASPSKRRSASSRVRIIVAEKYPLVRSGLRALLSRQPDFRIVAETESLSDVVHLVRKLRPDLLLLDPALVPPADQNTVRELAQKCCGLHIVALATPDAQHTAYALGLGTSAVLLKDASLDLVVMCVRSVMAGQYWMPRENVAALPGGRRAGFRWTGPSNVKFGLTAREGQILTAIAAGSTNKQIAEQLSISLATVKHHLTHVFEKTSLPNRLALATFAIEHHLVP
jgi:two-component system nitrate/nitrite response regulator NarL